MSLSARCKALPVSLKLFLIGSACYVLALALGFGGLFVASASDVGLGTLLIIYLLVGLAFFLSAGFLIHRFVLELALGATGLVFLMACFMLFVWPLTMADYAGLFLTTLIASGFVIVASWLAAKSLYSTLELCVETSVNLAKEQTSIKEVEQDFAKFEQFRNCHPDAPALLDEGFRQACHEFHFNSEA